MDGRHWRRWGRPAVAAAAGAVISWFAFVADRPVPILDWFDLAIHEAGHLLAFPLPQPAMFLAGSVAQVAFPLAMALYFWGRRDDVAAAAFCLAWAGTSAWDVSVYAGDAVTRALPLVGGGEHDWAYILGPNGFDALDMTSQVSRFIEFCGVVMSVAGIAAAVVAVASGLRRVTVRPPRREPISLERGADPWLDAARWPLEPVEEVEA